MDGLTLKNIWGHKLGSIGLTINISEYIKLVGEIRVGMDRGEELNIKIYCKNSKNLFIRHYSAC